MSLIVGQVLLSFSSWLLKNIKVISFESLVKNEETVSLFEKNTIG